MKRRNFHKKSAVAASLVSIPGSLLPLTSCKSQKSTETTKEEIRSAGYLQSVRSGKYLPKSPILAESKLMPDVRISPMSLKERLKRNIVPRQGFCSLAPGGDALISGNGAVNIEVAGNPYTEQIPFSHKSLFTPRKKSLEAPRIANVFPQVRQMILDGKYHEAVMIAYDEWQKNPVSRGMGGFGGGRFSMLVELPGGMIPIKLQVTIPGQTRYS